MANVRVSLDLNSTVQRMKEASDKAIYTTSQQALKDCNYFCKQDQGTLISSSQTHSDFEKGRLVWHTPYARKQYYLRQTTKDVNSNAEWMWAHKAAAQHKEDWKAVFQQAFKQFAKE